MDHLAWIAVDPSRPEEPALGTVRCVRSRAEPRVAEVAIFVVDELQGRGLGSLLFEVLAAAAMAAGIEVFRAAVLRENSEVVHALQELGVRGAIEDGILHVDVPVADALGLARSWNDAHPAA